MMVPPPPKCRSEQERERKYFIIFLKKSPLFSFPSSDIALAINADHGIAVVLSATAQAFDHHTADVHDDNIEAGAIMSLLHALDHVSRKIRVSQSPLGSTNEASLLLAAAAAGISALEMTTTRCSSEVLNQFVRDNCNELLPTLANLLTIFEASENQSSVVRRLLLQKTTNSLAVASSTNLIEEETEIDSQAIHQCCSALTFTLQNEGPGQIRSNCVAILLNFSRSTEQVRDTMLSTDLLDTLIWLIRSDALCTSRRIESEAMSTLHNLSESRGNSMASSEDLQLLLIDLMTGESSSSSIISAASLILQNMFRSSQKPTLLCSNDELVNALVVGLQNESGGITGQLACVGLINRFLKTADIPETNFNRADLVSAVFSLLVALLREEKSSSSQSLALETIYNLCQCTEGACYAIGRDKNTSSLLLGIISGTIGVSDASYAYCVKTIKCLASHPPNQKRQRLAKYRSIVPFLIAVAAKGSCSPDTKEAAIEAIVLLSRTAILV